MPTPPSPSPTPDTPEPNDSPWAAAARQLAANPDSPQSLRIMAAVNSAFAPRSRAIQQLVDALEGELVASGTPGKQDIAVGSAGGQ